MCLRSGIWAVHDRDRTCMQFGALALASSFTVHDDKNANWVHVSFTTAGLDVESETTTRVRTCRANQPLLYFMCCDQIPFLLGALV